MTSKTATKTVLLTGCSTGLGLEMAKLFHAEGWNVVATMRSPARSTLVAGDRMLVAALDVQKPATIDAAVAAALARFGGVDVLVNNAGVSMLGVFEEISRERIKEQLEVNVLGLMDVTRAVLPAMRRQRHGVIVNVSSGSGIVATPMLSAYHASKYAVEGFTESLMFELEPLGIHVKLVEPGAMLSTAFAQSTMTAAASNEAISDYEPFKNAMTRMFAAVMASGGVPNAATTEEVARVAFGAATDGTTRLRHVVGGDIAPLVEARQQTSEERYMATLRETFSFALGAHEVRT